jgi:hypothetical protein
MDGWFIINQEYFCGGHIDFLPTRLTFFIVKPFYIQTGIGGETDP